MELTFKRVAPVRVTLTGLAQTAQTKSVLWTVAHTVCAWGALVVVRKAGQAQHAIKELATHAARNTGPARTASASAARAGTGSTAPSRAVPVSATAMEGAHWTRMAGTVFASQGGEERAVM